MPNRVLRDWTDSDRVNLLAADAERFFTRLIMKADDFGCFFADPPRLKAFLFPLLPSIRDTDILRWIAACEKAELIRCYEATGKRYIAILSFGQRLRQMTRKYPQPPFDCTRPSDVGQSPTYDSSPRADDSNPLSIDRSPPRESEVETETEVETDPNAHPRGREGAEQLTGSRQQSEPPKPQPQPPAEFEAFWQAYPKKSGKGAALKPFQNALKRTTLEKLIAAVEQQKRSDQWQRDGGRYIPNPATWLNQGRWDDELPLIGATQTAAPSAHEARQRIAQIDAELEKINDTTVTFSGGVKSFSQYRDEKGALLPDWRAYRDQIKAEKEKLRQQSIGVQAPN